MYLQNASSTAASLAIYDSEAGTFGGIAAATIHVVSTAFTKQIAWIDAQHFVINDYVGSVAGCMLLRARDFPRSISASSACGAPIRGTRMCR